jgi:hypothetical protein
LTRTEQVACDHWVQEFNRVRPHEALGMRTPAELYVRSARPYRGVRTARYPFGMDERTVKRGGMVPYVGHRAFVGGGFAGYVVGVQRVAPTVLRIWFYEQDLGLFEVPELAADQGVASTSQSTTITPKPKSCGTPTSKPQRTRTRRRLR